MSRDPNIAATLLLNRAVALCQERDHLAADAAGMPDMAMKKVRAADGALREAIIAIVAAAQPHITENEFSQHLVKMLTEYMPKPGRGGERDQR